MGTCNNQETLLQASSPVMDPGSLYHISFLLSISFQYLDDWSLGKRDSVLGDLSLANFDSIANSLFLDVLVELD